MCDCIEKAEMTANDLMNEVVEKKRNAVVTERAVITTRAITFGEGGGWRLFAPVEGRYMQGKKVNKFGTIPEPSCIDQLITSTGWSWLTKRGRLPWCGWVTAGGNGDSGNSRGSTDGLHTGRNILHGKNVKPARRYWEAERWIG